jgi:hypothetical protein
VKLLYIGTAGTDDPTRATFPFIMAKGAIDGRPRGRHHPDGRSRDAHTRTASPRRSIGVACRRSKSSRSSSTLSRFEYRFEASAAGPWGHGKRFSKARTAASAHQSTPPPHTPNTTA